MALRSSLLPGIVVYAVVACCACTSSDGQLPEAGPQGPVLAGASSVAVSGRNVRISWSKTPDCNVVIERKDPGAADFHEVASRPGSHGQHLDLALQPSTTYQYRIKACSNSVCGAPILPAPVTTRASKLPQVTLSLSSPAAGPEILVMGIGSLAGGYLDNGIMMAVDRTGTILWEYENNKEGVITELAVLPGGRFAAEQLLSLVELDLDGSVIRKFAQRPTHHALDPMADGRYALVTFDRMQQPGRVLLGDGIAILSADWNTVEWEWLARDHIPLQDVCPVCINDDPYSLGFDWTHANGLTFDDAEQKLYFNVRNLNRIYKIDYPSGEVDWIMGDGGDFGAGLWAHSHSPEFLPGNHVLMLDNGYHRSLQQPGAPDYSRVIEIAFDPVAKTAEVVWEYRETPDFYAFALGSVHRLASGNTLLADGFNSRMLEISPGLEKVWEIKLQEGFGTYKAITVPADFFQAW